MAKLPRQSNQQMRVTLLLTGLLMMFLLVHLIARQEEGPTGVKFSEFMDAASLPEGNPSRLAEVTFKEGEIIGIRADKSIIRTYGPSDADIRRQLLEKKVAVNYEPPEEVSWWKSLIASRKQPTRCAACHQSE